MSNISVRWTMKLKRQKKSHSQTQLNYQISALLQERNPITLFCWFKYARYLDGGRLSLNVSCSQKLQRASSARLGLEMRQHVCGARTKREFSTWVKGDLRPSQSTVHKKTCSHPQHRFRCGESNHKSQNKVCASIQAELVFQERVHACAPLPDPITTGYLQSHAFVHVFLSCKITSPSSPSFILPINNLKWPIRNSNLVTASTRWSYSCNSEDNSWFIECTVTHEKCCFVLSIMALMWHAGTK